MKLAFVGGGLMGEAIISAVLKSELVTSDAIKVSDVSDARLDALLSRYGVEVTSDNGEAVAGANIVVLATKPQDFAAAGESIRGRLPAGQTALSIMAGVPMARISEALAHENVARAMPNTPALVGEALTVWTTSEAVGDKRIAEIRRLLASLGREIHVPAEKYIDLATAVSGSGPGYVLLFIEAFIDAAVRLGFRREIATSMVLQTVRGSVQMAEELGKHPAELRNMVTSPGGTTAEGLHSLEQSGLRAALADAVQAAYERALELGG